MTTSNDPSSPEDRPERRNAGTLFDRFFLGKRDLLLIWIGQVASGLGDSLISMGFIFLVLDLTGDERAVGLFQAVAYLPIVVFGLAAGVYVDRRDRRRVMLAADAGRALMLGSLPVVALIGGLDVWYAGLTVVIASTCMTFFNPAYNSALPILVGDPSRLFGVNALMQSSRQFASIAGPALAAFGLARSGPLTLLSVNAVTYLISFGCIAMISTALRSHVGGRIRADELRREAMLGLRVVTGHRNVRMVFLLTLVNNVLLMGPAIVATPLLVIERFGGSMGDFALIELMYACGMAVTSLMLHRLPGIRNVGILWGIGLTLDGFTFLLYLAAGSLPLLYAATFIHALAIPLIVVPRTTIIQRLLPQEMLGRAFGYIDIAVLGITSLSAMLTGFVVKEIGPLTTIVYGGFLAGTVGVVALLLRSVNGVRFVDDAVPDGAV